MPEIATDPAQRFRAIYLAPGAPEAVTLSHTPQLDFRADEVYAVTLLDGNGLPNPDEAHAALAVIRLVRQGLVIIETATGLVIVPERDLPQPA